MYLSPEHGVPEELFSDHRSQFESDIIQTVCKRHKKKRTTPYHPRGNGMVERFNRTVKDQLAKPVHDSGGEWDYYCICQQLFFPSMPLHTSTGYSPYFLAHGREPRLPADVFFSLPGVSETPQNYGSSWDCLDLELIGTMDVLDHASYVVFCVCCLTWSHGDISWVISCLGLKKKKNLFGFEWGHSF